MATGTADGKGGGSKVVPLGKGKSSSNESLGIDKRVAGGTAGSRDSMAHAKYGGDRTEGDYFVGKSTAPVSKELNSGGNGRPSKGAGVTGPGSYQDGTYASRENMTIGGGENKGKLVGKGANATKAANPSGEYGGEKAKADGTADDRKQMARAKIGNGKGSKQNDI